MDPLAIFMVVLFAGFLLAVVLLGIFAPGSGARQLDWRPTRSPEAEAQNELDDVDQMVEAINARRRARGEGELTEDDFQRRVVDHRHELEDRHG